MTFVIRSISFIAGPISSNLLVSLALIQFLENEQAGFDKRHCSQAKTEGISASGQIYSFIWALLEHLDYEINMTVL
jgi:hypothetical protein